MDRGLFYQEPELQLTAFSHVRAGITAGVPAAALLVLPLLLSHYCYRSCSCPGNHCGSFCGFFPVCSSALPPLGWLPCLHESLTSTGHIPAYIPHLQFYDVPAVSVRAAAWHLMHAGVDHFKASPLACPACPACLATCSLPSCRQRLSGSCLPVCHTMLRLLWDSGRKPFPCSSCQCRCIKSRWRSGRTCSCSATAATSSATSPWLPKPRKGCSSLPISEHRGLPCPSALGRRDCGQLFNKAALQAIPSHPHHACILHAAARLPIARRAPRLPSFPQILRYVPTTPPHRLLPGLTLPCMQRTPI